VRKAICSTSTLLYLHRLQALVLLPKLFDEVWVPSDVLEELQRARFIGLDVPHLFDYDWIKYTDPQATLPSAWLAQELSNSDLVVMSLGFEIPGSIILIDDGQARKSGHVAGLSIWGTLQVLLEAKISGLIKDITPYVDRMDTEMGMWLSEKTRQRILRLVGEATPGPEAESPDR
jgi:predicted nucleic acid-binding protein